MREFLLCCRSCNEYTSLGAYDEAERRFEGEYSLLYNERTRNDAIFTRFLHIHAGHSLLAAVNGTEEYSQTIATARHFMEEELDKYVEESLWRQGEIEQRMTMDRGLGRLQLSILRKLLEEEAAQTARLKTESAAESQFILGKEEGLKRAVELLRDLQEKTSVYYK
ncbi:hypothetical protein [Paenibacillus alkalitolerans]|uniref:hypothetical protein n=1 Tax=Paenibacillus alkalitolerans TaxID=2799335 RepID=UPI0018F40351|nr:hypothetical protein [Paenibacillus alkalitolerans]